MEHARQPAAARRKREKRTSETKRIWRIVTPRKRKGGRDPKNIFRLDNSNKSTNTKTQDSEYIHKKSSRVGRMVAFHDGSASVLQLLRQHHLQMALSRADAVQKHNTFVTRYAALESNRFVVRFGYILVEICAHSERHRTRSTVVVDTR